MNTNYLFQIRVTGILIEEGKILLVQQKLKNREWSLPGGRLEAGELVEEGLLREMIEETGLETEIIRLLYVCDKPDVSPPMVHMTFLLKRINGTIVLPTNEFDDNPISDVKFVRIEDIPKYGFSHKFQSIIQDDFPRSGNYMGLKDTIGL